MPSHIGILTSGGDCPGLNAAVRGVGRAAREVFRMELLGFRDGFRGLVHDRCLPLESNEPTCVAEAVRNRARAGKRFSIVVVAEGAMSAQNASLVSEIFAEKEKANSKSEKKNASQRLDSFHQRHIEHTVRLTEQLEKMTGQESRLTILGHLQRGGTPSPADRLLATRLGTACAEVLHQRTYGVMLAARGDRIVPVPLEDVAGKKKFVPPDHPWIQAARLVGTSFGD
jgi:6-phosphofructokinase 1